MRMNKRIAVLLLAITMTACSSCNKPVAQPLPETPYTKAARAADDIAGGIKLLLAAELNLAQQKLITPQEDLLVINAIGSLNTASVQFTNDVDAARLAGNQSLLVPSAKALVKAGAGIAGLTIKNPKAKQTFDGIMVGVNLALSVVSGFIQ